MVNHTKPSPEPWHANGFFVMDADGLVVAEVLSENPIDARVVSAAGELLAALHVAADMIPAPSENMNCHSGITTMEKCSRCSRSASIRAAIAKADGRS